jgi:sugar/nucleoside kinase (ribokinase family)
VVVVGSASRDIAPDDPRGWRLGGGVTYGALTLGRLGVPTAALVGVDPQTADAWELDRLRKAGVELRLAGLGHGPVFENVEHPTGRIQTCLDPGEPLEPSALPASWRATGAWLLAPVADELPPAWADIPSVEAFVALGWQGLLRELGAGAQVTRRDPRPSALVRRADLVGVSRDDLDRAIPLEALFDLMRPPVALLLTCGADGGFHVDLRRDASVRWRRYRPLPCRIESDPTGAGDVMLAALLAARVVGGDERTAPGADLRFAAAAASLVVERPGLLGVPGLAAIAGRLTGRA